MSSNTAKVHFPQGAESLQVDAGGKITAAGSQAGAIADIDTNAGEMTQTEREKFNAVLAALRGVGVIAAS